MPVKEQRGEDDEGEPPEGQRRPAKDDTEEDPLERAPAERHQAAFEMVAINGLARLRRRNNQKRPARITVREPSAESASSVTSSLAVCAD
jgi:hypothetical protein